MNTLRYDYLLRKLATILALAILLSVCSLRSLVYS
jgi:hypothetical protein